MCFHELFLLCFKDGHGKRVKIIVDNPGVRKNRYPHGLIPFALYCAGCVKHPLKRLGCWLF